MNLKKIIKNKKILFFSQTIRSIQKIINHKTNYSN